MNTSINCLCISQEDQLSAGCFNLKEAIAVTEKAINDYANNRVLYPDKVCQIFDQKSQNRINCLPATLFEEKICGMKWVSVFPNNPSQLGVQNVSAVLILSNLENGFPVAFMEGTLCSNIRTASITAVAAKYLARKNSQIIGLIGAGEQAKMHFAAIKTQFPGIKLCRVASRSPEREAKFVSDLSQLFPDVAFVKCNASYRFAAEDADIIITAISGQAPLLQAEWISPGTFYGHIGGWEDDFAVPLKAQKIVCDNWDMVKHRTQTISMLYKEGKLHDEDIYADIHELVSEQKPGRENESEFIYFNVVGLSYVDVALAFDFYKKVRAKKLGVDFKLQSAGIFDHQLKLSESGETLFA
jgi:ornithine cyclodeaminase/alanine dehydrogenase-like protein (mu-crystallin family)